MNELVALLVDRKAIPLAARAGFAREIAGPHGETEAMAGWASGVTARQALPLPSSVVLSTCERFEVYSLAGTRVRNQWRHRLTPWLAQAREVDGIHALRHLFRVASGLESRITGEPQVLGQVRAALVSAGRQGCLNQALSSVFSHALRCGRRVRRLTGLGRVSTDYATIAVKRLRISGQGVGENAHVAVIGSGALARDVVQQLYKAGVTHVTISGRHQGRIQRLAAEYNAFTLPLDRLHNEPTRFDAIITAVSASDPIITARTLACCRVPLIIDLGTAPNVDPAARNCAGVTILGLDDLGIDPRAQDALPAATAVVESAICRFEAHARTCRMQGTASVDRRAS